jgi:large conductance mechanosensitive channel
MFKDFKAFLMRGNVVDMAVGIVIGVAFGLVVKSFVDDILMPPVGLLVGNVDFSNIFFVLKQGKVPGPYPSVADARAVGAVTWNLGVFINTIINFLILAASIFLVIRALNKLYPPKPSEPEKKICPYCLSTIPIQATRCPHCTSELAKA